MGFRQSILPIAIVGLSALALYLTIARHLLQDPRPAEQRASREPAMETRPAAAGAEPRAVTPGASGKQPQAALPATPGGRKLLEVYGRVLDREQRPIADALITEERYFYTARSDDDGRYRILLDMPRHRYPNLHFLRSGYAGMRVRLDEDDLGSEPLHELDIVLDEAADTVSLQGWIGNDIGEDLEGARIELIAAQRAARDSYYLTTFSDESGNFEFEGVRADETYKLSANLAPDYPYYEDPEFRVSRNPARVEIKLERLHFVDIDGMIRGRDGSPVPNYEMYISNLTTGSHSRKIASDSSGYFALRGFPVGEVSMSTRGPEFYKITGLEITETHFQNLELRVDRGPRYLSGWVSDENGIAVEKAMVTLDRGFRDGDIEYSSYRSQATDRNGGFSFANLGDDEYRLIVYALGFRQRDIAYRFDSPAAEIYITLERY
jgi:hypothetical protein